MSAFIRGLACGLLMLVMWAGGCSMDNQTVRDGGFDNTSAWLDSFGSDNHRDRKDDRRDRDRHADRDASHQRPAPNAPGVAHDHPAANHPVANHPAPEHARPAPGHSDTGHHKP
jgi:hypothetical protein